MKRNEVWESDPLVWKISWFECWWLGNEKRFVPGAASARRFTPFSLFPLPLGAKATSATSYPGKGGTREQKVANTKRGRDRSKSDWEQSSLKPSWEMELQNTERTTLGPLRRWDAALGHSLVFSNSGIRGLGGYIPPALGVDPFSTRCTRGWLLMWELLSPPAWAPSLVSDTIKEKICILSRLLAMG